MRVNWILMCLAMVTGWEASATPDYSKRLDQPELPRQIWGSWDSSLAECKNQYSTSRLAIGIDWVGFYESEGRLLHTTPGGSVEGETVVARFVMGGEAATWDLELRFQYFPNQPNALLLSFEKGSAEERYVKCAD